MEYYKSIDKDGHYRITNADGVVFSYMCRKLVTCWPWVKMVFLKRPTALTTMTPYEDYVIVTSGGEVKVGRLQHDNKIHIAAINNKDLGVISFRDVVLAERVGL